jgi:hypothetical protein
MRVTHIVPAAFNYFEDIRSAAFQLAGGLQNIGIEAELFTLQYESVNKKMKTEAQEASKNTHAYIGSMNGRDLIEDLNGSDLVHMHCPFLGAARLILQWRQYNPRTPFLVSYYRDVAVPDIFASYIWLYNRIYMPKIFKAANAIICQSRETIGAFSGVRSMPEDKKVFFLDQIPVDKKIKTQPFEMQLAVKTAMVYNNFIA